MDASATRGSDELFVESGKWKPPLLGKVEINRVIKQTIHMRPRVPSLSRHTVSTVEIMDQLQRTP